MDGGREGRRIHETIGGKLTMGGRTRTLNTGLLV